MTLTKRILAASLGTLLVLSGCQNSSKLTEETQLSEGTEVALSPKTDFYTFMNQEWLEKTEIPSDSPSISNFYEANKKNEALIKELLEQLRANYDNLEDGSDYKKIVDLYNQALDFETRNQLGVEPIKAQLEKIRSVDNLEEFGNLSIDSFLSPVSKGIVSLGPDADFKDSNHNILYISVPSVSLAKNYYEDKDDFSGKIREASKEYIIEVLTISGNNKEEATQKAELIANLEKQLVSSFLKTEEQINKEVLYNEYTLDELKAFTEGLPIMTAIDRLDLARADKIIVMQPKAIEKLKELYTQDNLEAFKAQLEYFTVSSSSNLLSKDLILAEAKLSEAMTGISNTPSDEELAYAFVNDKLGYLIGKAYVEKHFPASAKQDILSMIDDIKTVYRERITAVDWLADSTKDKALEKLDKLTVKVAYPDKWEDYSDLDIKTYDEGGNLYVNMEAITARNNEKALATLNQAPDRDKWQMKPQDINAYYNPVFNEIVFPAGILQVPFYDVNADREANLGAIGAVIGHEISPAFDASGAQFDAEGNLNLWWTPEDYDKFGKKVKKAAEIYSALEVLPGYHVNGEISTGEILADLGGLRVVLEVAKKDNLDTKKVFESYAHVWRDKSTKEAMILGLTDEHPPSKFRVNNIVNLMDEFYSDFDVKENDPMYVKPEDRLNVW